MAVKFNDVYEKMFREHMEIMGSVEAVLIGKNKNNGVEPKVFKIVGIPGRQLQNITEEGITGMLKTIKFLKSDLLAARDIKDEIYFPYSNMNNEIVRINFSNRSYTLNDTEVNSFDNVVICKLDKIQ